MLFEAPIWDSTGTYNHPGVFIDADGQRWRLISLKRSSEFFRDSDGNLLRSAPRSISTAQTNSFDACAILPINYNPPSEIGLHPDGSVEEIFDFEVLQNKAVSFAFQPSSARTQNDTEQTGVWFFKTAPLSQDYVFDLLFNKNDSEAIENLSAFAERIILPYVAPEWVTAKETREIVLKNNSRDTSTTLRRHLFSDFPFTIAALFLGAIYCGETK